MYDMMGNLLCVIKKPGLLPDSLGVINDENAVDNSGAAWYDRTRVQKAEGRGPTMETETQGLERPDVEEHQVANMDEIDFLTLLMESRILEPA